MALQVGWPQPLSRLIIKNQMDPHVTITLIESADIPTIGVGEGTWPTMKNTLQQIGLSERDFFRSCHAAFKQGGKFVNWCHGNGDFYYHPFTVPLGYGRIDVAPYLSRIFEIMPVKPICSMSLCEAGKAPRARCMRASIRGSLNYAYHLDAGAFADVLKQHAKTKLGVLHRDCHCDGRASRGRWSHCWIAII